MSLHTPHIDESERLTEEEAALDPMVALSEAFQKILAAMPEDPPARHHQISTGPDMLKTFREAATLDIKRAIETNHAKKQLTTLARKWKNERKTPITEDEVVGPIYAQAIEHIDSDTA